MKKLFLFFLALSVLMGCSSSSNETIPIPKDAAMVFQFNMKGLSDKVSMDDIMTYMEKLAPGATREMKAEAGDDFDKGMKIVRKIWRGEDFYGVDASHVHMFLKYGKGPKDMIFGIVIKINDAKKVRKELFDKLEVDKADRPKFKKKGDLWLIDAKKNDDAVGYMNENWMVFVSRRGKGKSKSAVEDKALHALAKNWMALDEDKSASSQEAFQTMQKEGGPLAFYYNAGPLYDAITADNPMMGMVDMGLYKDLSVLFNFTFPNGRARLTMDTKPEKLNKEIWAMGLVRKDGIKKLAPYLPAHTTMASIGLSLDFEEYLRMFDKGTGGSGAMNEVVQKMRPYLVDISEIFTGRIYAGLLDMSLKPSLNGGSQKPDKILYMAVVELKAKGMLSKKLVPWLQEKGIELIEEGKNRYSLKVAKEHFYFVEDKGVLIVSNDPEIEAKWAKNNPEKDKTLDEQMKMAESPFFLYGNLNGDYLPRGLVAQPKLKERVEAFGGQRFACYLTKDSAIMEVVFESEKKNGLLTIFDSVLRIKEGVMSGELASDDNDEYDDDDYEVLLDSNE